MKTVQIGLETYQMATRWSETPAAQLEQLLPLQLVDMPEDPGQSAKLKFAAAKILLGNPAAVDTLDEGQKWRLMNLARWVFTTRIQSRPFDHFRFKGIEYVLPADGFATSSAIEVAMANFYYLAYADKEKPNVGAVFQLVATLCRPKRKDLAAFKKSIDWNGDIREGYNGVLVEDRAKAFRDLPIGQVMAILQFFEHTNNAFLASYKPVYTPDEQPDEPLYKDGRGLITTFMDIAKLGVFGDFDKVCNQPAHTVWLFLQDNNLKIQRANKKAEDENEA